MLDDIPAVSSYSNIYINAISSDELGNVGLDAAEKLDKFTIYKFDSLSAYNLSGSQFGITSSDLILIDEDMIDAENQPIINVGAPQNDTDAATKKYVDDTASRLGTLSNDLAIQNFYNTLTSTTGGIDTINVNTILSAVASLVKIIGYNK